MGIRRWHDDSKLLHIEHQFHIECMTGDIWSLYNILDYRNRNLIRIWKKINISRIELLKWKKWIDLRDVKLSQLKKKNTKYANQMK